MKRILSLVLVFVLVLGTFPVFADVTDYGAELKAMGLLSGDENGNLNPDQPLDRASMMVVLATYYGVLEDAQAFPLDSTFTDVAPTDWFAEIVAYAQVEGWTSGYGDGTFGPTDATTEQMACAFMLRALGYTDAWETAIEDAAAMGIETDASAGFTRANLFELMYETLHTENTDGVVLGVALGVMGEPTADEIMVEDIAVLNLVEVEVVFNTELDEDEAEDEANYTIEDHAFTADLQDDGMTVLLTMDDGEEFDNQETFELEIDGVEDVTGDLVLEDFVSEELEAFDADIPVALGVELTGPDSFDITFSEPVQEMTGGDYEDFDVEIEGGIYGVSDVEFDGATVSVTIGTDLDEGEYEVEVSGAYDFAGFKANDETFTLEFDEDEDAPVATIDSASQTEVVIVFDEDVFFMEDEDADPVETGAYGDYTFDAEDDEFDGDNDILDFFYHSYSSYNPVEVEIDGDEVTLTFDNGDADEDHEDETADNPLPEGTVKIVIDVDAHDGVMDAWGNVVEDDIVLYVEVVSDDEAPEVSAIETEDMDQDQFEIYFNEELNMDDGDSISSSDFEDYVVVLDDDDEELDIDYIDYYQDDDDDEYYVVVDMDEDLEGTFTVTIASFEDASFSENEMDEVTMTFEKEDESAPSLSDIDAEYVVDGDDVILYIMFEEDMAADGAYSVLDEENYLIDGYEFDDFCDDFEIELFGGADTVKVTFEDANDLDPDTLEVARLADEAGNKSEDLYAEIDIYEVKAPKVTSIQTLSEKKIEIIVNGELSSVTTDGFYVENDGTSDELASVSFSYDSDDEETTIIATMKSDQHLEDPSDVPEAVYVIGEEIEDMFGQYMEAYTETSISDGYAPEFLEDDFEDDYYEDGEFYSDMIFMPFNEDITGDDTYFAADFLVEVDGDEMVPFADYNVYTTDGGVYLVFEDMDDLEDGFDVEVMVEDANYVSDQYDNVVDDFEFELTYIENK